MKNFEKAELIWQKDIKKNSYTGFVKNFNVSKIQNIKIKIFAELFYKLYINGSFVNAGPAHFERPNVMYDLFDISSFLKKGENTIFVISHYEGVDLKYNYPVAPGLILTIDDSDEKCLLKTDSSWEVYPLGCWVSNTCKRNWALGFIEDLDLGDADALVLAKYAKEDYFCDSGEKFPKAIKPTIVDKSSLRFNKRIQPNISWRKESVSNVSEIYETCGDIHDYENVWPRLGNESLKPISDIEKYNILDKSSYSLTGSRGELGYVVEYDLRRISAGEIFVEVECDSTQIVDIVYLERKKDNRPYFTPGTFFYNRVRFTKGINRYRMYQFFGFRYILLVVKNLNGLFKIKNVSINHCSADLNYDINMITQDKKLNQIYEISKRAIITNGQSSCFDCISREQGTYWGDNLWVTDMVGHLTGDFTYMKQLVYVVKDSLPKDNILKASLYGISPILFDYSLVPVIMLGRYYDYTGDLSSVKDTIGGMKDIVDAFREYKNKDGLLDMSKHPAYNTPNHWDLPRPFLDHPGTGFCLMETTPIDRDYPNCGLTLFYLWALMELDKLQKINGDLSLGDEIKTVRKKCYDYFFIKERGMLTDARNENKKDFSFSQIVNALGVITGVLEGDEARYAMKSVLNIDEYPFVSSGTPYSYFYIVEAMAICGLNRDMLSEIRKRYQPMIDGGATTTWETFKLEIHDSLNHAWSAAPIYHLYRGVAGIRPVSPGYKNIIIEPDFHTFYNIDLSFTLPVGKVAISWERKSSNLTTVKLSVPTECDATLIVRGKSISIVSKLTIDVNY